MLEALPEGAGKGTAVAALAERHRPRSVLALGDDLTDVAMFEAARALRAGGAQALAVAVAGGAETPPEVVAAADAVVAQEAGRGTASRSSRTNWRGRPPA